MFINFRGERQEFTCYAYLKLQCNCNTNLIFEPNHWIRQIESGVQIKKQQQRMDFCMPAHAFI